MPLSKDLREFIECLNSNRVEYLIVGAFAVSWHGFPRYSGDVDFLVRPSAPNAEHVIRAIAQFGLASLGITVSDLDVPGKVIQIGFEPNRIDLMTSITAVTFDEAWASRSSGQLDGIEVNFIGRAELLRNKESTGRSKDLIDVIELRKQDILK
jgi:predicted nucleotidyltransferase